MYLGCKIASPVKETVLSIFLGPDRALIKLVIVLTKSAPASILFVKGIKFL